MSKPATSSSAAQSEPAEVSHGRVQGGLLATLREPTTIVMVVVLCAGFVLFFRDWILRQHHHSWGSGDWSHAYMVPFISLYLLWQHRDELDRAVARTYWPGLASLLMGVVCYVFFLIGPTSNHLGQGLAIILTVFGLVLLLAGPDVMKFAFLPIAYLVFAITLPQKVMIAITWPLQQLAAKGAYIGLQMVGVQSSIVGNVITVTNSSGVTCPLNVAEACSGMRMLIAFMALGAAVALVATRMWWKRVVLLGMAPPIALLLNVLRVMVLGFLSLYNPGLASGQAHTFIGTLLLIPGFFMFMGIVVALNKAVPESEEPALPATASVQGVHA